MKPKRSRKTASAQPHRLQRLVSRQLAERITNYLFTPGGWRKKADRLALMFDGEDVCGWGYKPATDAVQKIIESANDQAHAPANNPK